MTKPSKPTLMIIHAQCPECAHQYYLHLEELPHNWRETIRDAAHELSYSVDSMGHPWEAARELANKLRALLGEGESDEQE